jgi:ethanolamine permease
MARKLKSVVRYGNVSADYLQKRQLRRGIGFWLLFGSGVGIVIDGIYAGWNEGLAQGGFWGMCIATALVGGMYLVMTFSMAELSAALPHAGGFYAFTRTAFGAVGGFICGLGELLEYILIMGWGHFYLAQTFHNTLGLPSVPLGSFDLVDVAITLVYTAIVTALTIYSTEFALRYNLFIAIVSIFMLLVLVAGVIFTGKFDPQLLFTIQPSPEIKDASNFLPRGSLGLLGSIPYAVWFYLAIEAMPLTAEEAKDPVKDLPKAMITAMVLLLILSVLILVFNTGIGIEKTTKSGEVVRGAAAIAVTGEPLAAGMDYVFGKDNFLANLLGVGTLLAGLTGGPACMYAYGRIFFAMSRAGYIPQWISVTNDRGIPARATILGSVLSVLVTALFILAGGEKTAIGLGLVTVSVVSALVTYILVLASYIKLRVDRPGMPRPYRSPVGILGAFLGLVIATIAFIACFVLEAYRVAVYLTAGFIAMASLYFILIGRHQLVAEAPEEQLFLAEDSTLLSP